jgi:pimeloyl-ACP methyl ester carboxylesterase
MKMNESYLEIGDELLYVRHNGIEPGRKSLLLVHGLGDSGLSFEDVFAYEQFDNTNIIVPDLVGYGRSSRSAKKSGYCYDAHVDRLWELIRRYDLEDVTLVGHSMGGDITTLMCQSDTRGIISEYLNIEGDVTQFDPSMSKAAVKAAGENRFNIWFTDDFRERFVFRTLGKHRSGRLYYASLGFCRPEAFLENSKELVRRNSSLLGEYKSEIGEKYCSIEIPKLFCYGTRSIPKGTLAFLRDRNLNCRAFEGIGHCPMTDAADEFYAVLWDFIHGRS